MSKQIEAKEERERRRDRINAEKLASHQKEFVLAHSEILVMNALRHSAKKAGCYKLQERVRLRSRGQSPLKVSV